MSEQHPFAIINQNQVVSSWNGQPQILQVNESAQMPQTTNGTMIVAMTNQATQNNMGSIAQTSGGSQPEFFDVPPLTGYPEVQIKNFQANNLNLTNISANASTPIQVQAVGPGIPGTTPIALPLNTPTVLEAGQTAQGPTNPQFMQLVMQSNSATVGIIGVIGGPVDESGNNGDVYGINFSAAKPPNYTQVTPANSITTQFNWNGAQIFVANLSPETANAITITLRAL